MHTRIKNSWIKHLDFILADLICINISFFAAYCLRYGEVSNMYAQREYRSLVLVMALLHFFVIFFSNAYSGILKRGYLDELKYILMHNLELVLLMFAYMFFSQMGDSYSRIVLVSFCVMDIIVMYLVHTVLKYVQRHSDRQEFLIQNIMIVTQTQMAERAIEKITSGPDKSFRIKGIALVGGEDSGEAICEVPVLAESADQAYEYACRHVVDGVFIDLPGEKKREIEEISGKFLEMGITVHIDMDIYIEGVPNTYFGHMNEARVMTAAINSMSPMEKYAKRGLDILAGIVGCLITAVLYIFVAPAIKIADPKGPIFFCQQRVGKNGRIFKMYKFRSMYADAEERKKELMDDNKMTGLMFKIDADPRIIGSGVDGTKKGLGHFLRSTSIDEFPNFFSILKGDMSLVGTRPPTMDEYEKYELHHKSRLSIKPGLTGMWQISGRSDVTDFEEIVKLDNEYIRNWSIGLDLRIIIKTFFSVLGRKGSV